MEFLSPPCLLIPPNVIGRRKSLLPTPTQILLFAINIAIAPLAVGLPPVLLSFGNSYSSSSSLGEYRFPHTLNSRHRANISSCVARSSVDSDITRFSLWFSPLEWCGASRSTQLVDAEASISLLFDFFSCSSVSPHDNVDHFCLTPLTVAAGAPTAIHCHSGLVFLPM